MALGEHRGCLGRCDDRVETWLRGCDKLALKVEKTTACSQPSPAQQAFSGPERVIERSVRGSDGIGDRPDGCRRGACRHDKVLDGVEDLVGVVNPGARHGATLTEQALFYRCVSVDDW